MLSNVVLVFAVTQLYTVRSATPQIAEGRIIGGLESNPYNTPYMVYMAISDEDDPDYGGICGGSLVSAQHVLTAAHCISRLKNVKLVYILVGAHHIRQEESNRQKIFADKFRVHKDYNKPQQYANDLAIIKLKTPVTLNPFARLVTLPTAEDAHKTYVGETATAYGWGLIHDKPISMVAEVLMTVNVTVISNADCLDKISEKDVYDGDMCTDGTGNKGTCAGDSGGPLMLNDVQIGVVSRGSTAFCERNDPSVYVRVASYLQWINNTIKALQ